MYTPAHAHLAYAFSSARARAHAVYTPTHAHALSAQAAALIRVQVQACSRFAARASGVRTRMYTHAHACIRTHARAYARTHTHSSGIAGRSPGMCMVGFQTHRTVGRSALHPKHAQYVCNCNHGALGSISALSVTYCPTFLSGMRVGVSALACIFSCSDRCRLHSMRVYVDIRQ